MAEEGSITRCAPGYVTAGSLTYPLVKRYSTTPEVVEAAEVTQDNASELAKWCGGAEANWDNGFVGVDVPSITGVFRVELGDFLVRNLETGRFRKYTKEDFAKFHPVGQRQDGLVPRTITTSKTGASGYESGEAHGAYADTRYFNEGGPVFNGK